LAKKNYHNYKESGVDVKLGDECSQIAYQACQQTFCNQNIDLVTPETLEGGFSGPLQIIEEIKGSYLVKNSDGVGSKAIVAQRMNKHHTLGYDLVAMLADDTSSIGAIPIAGTNTIDSHHAQPELVTRLMEGLVKACKIANISMVGGEIAELPDQVKGYSNPYIWNGDLLGLLEVNKQITGSNIAPDQSIVALRSRGIRSNGLTLARKICTQHFGNKWHEKTFKEGINWGDILLTPSRICTPALVSLNGSYRENPRAKVTGIVHITGGGLSNLDRILPEGMGASIDNLFAPQEEFLQLQKLGPIEDKEAYKTWNMGQCMLIVTPEPEKVKKVMSEFDIPSQISGKITQKSGIRVQGRGLREEAFSL